MIRAGATTDDIASFLSSGETDEDDASEVFEVWRENWKAVLLFLHARRCWHFAGMGGHRYAFDVGAAERVWAMRGEKVTAKRFMEIDIIADGALDEMSKISAEEREESKSKT